MNMNYCFGRISAKLGVIYWIRVQ